MLDATTSAPTTLELFTTPTIEPPTTLRCRRFYIPDGLDWLALVNGAISLLLNPENFVQREGGISIDLATETFAQMWASMTECNMIGSIHPYMTAEPPENCIPCDGGVYDATVWPELMAVIDDVFKLNEFAFFAPDLRGRTIVGAGAGGGLTERELAFFGGEESHMLGYTEMFPHNHATEQTNDIIIKVPDVGTDTTISGASFATATGVTPIFDQTALNIMQPFFVLKYYIVAR